MPKKNQGNLLLFVDAIGLYFSNVKEFILYMSFPVLGQIIGLVWIFATSYFYSINMPSLVNKYSEFNNINTLFITLLLITLPGVSIFLKALWEYLISYGAINSMYANMQKSGRVYDFKAHTELIKRRSFSFVCLLSIIGIFSILAVCPLLWVLSGIVAVYLSLVFQVFTFETELSPLGCIKKSFFLIKGHYAEAIGLIVLLASSTYILIPQLVLYGFKNFGFRNWVAEKLILPLVLQIPIPDLSMYSLNMFSNIQISNFIFDVIIAQIIVQYTLPIRSIACSLFYKKLSKNSLSFTSSIQAKNKVKSKTKRIKNSSKRPSEILMENTHKKYGTKKLDRNLLKRASEKDE